MKTQNQILNLLLLGVLAASPIFPGRGWFAYFRIYGPEAPAFDGSWKPGDFQVVK